jgi:hypothetical protein
VDCCLAAADDEGGREAFLKKKKLEKKRRQKEAHGGSYGETTSTLWWLQLVGNPCDTRLNYNKSVYGLIGIEENNTALVFTRAGKYKLIRTLMDKRPLKFTAYHHVQPAHHRARGFASLAENEIVYSF